MRSGEQVQLEIKASVETQSSKRVSPRRVDSSERCRRLIVLAPDLRRRNWRESEVLRSLALGLGSCFSHVWVTS